MPGTRHTGMQRRSLQDTACNGSAQPLLLPPALLHSPRRQMFATSPAATPQRHSLSNSNWKGIRHQSVEQLHPPRDGCLKLVNDLRLVQHALGGLVLVGLRAGQAEAVRQPVRGTAAAALSKQSEQQWPGPGWSAGRSGRRKTSDVPEQEVPKARLCSGASLSA